MGKRVYLNYGRFHREVSRKHVVFYKLSSLDLWISGSVIFTLTIRRVFKMKNVGKIKKKR